MSLESCRVFTTFLQAPRTKTSPRVWRTTTAPRTGCTDDFDTSNYGVRTNPRKEYEIATGRRECPAEDMLDKKGKKVRVVKRIDALKVLKIARKARLTEDEILAVVRTPPVAGILPCRCNLRIMHVLRIFLFFAPVSQRCDPLVCSQMLYTGPMFEVPHPRPCHAPFPPPPLR